MFYSRVFARLSLALCSIVFAQAGMADSSTKLIPDAAAAAKTQGTKVSFAPQERAIGGPSARQPAAAIADGPEFVFSAPPRGSYSEEVAIYQPIVEYLSRVRWIEEVGHRAVVALEQRQFEFFQEAADRQPEIVADEDQALQAFAVALP